MSENAQYKLIVLGDSGVGKTSIISQYINKKFSYQMTSTVGTSHSKAEVNVDGRVVDLRIWDTAGQEKYSALVPMFSRGAQVCLIVASIVDDVSKKNLGVWKERLYDSGEHPPIVIAINKVDLVNKDDFKDKIYNEILKEKTSNDIFFVSAKTGDSLRELFECIARRALETDPRLTASVKITKQRRDSDEDKKGCC